MAAPAEYRWRKDGEGNPVMPDPQTKYLDWLVDPNREPATHKEYAALVGISDRTLRMWRNDERFKKEWRARAEKENVSPERTTAVTENLWKLASSGGGMSAVKAAELYLRYVQMFTPVSKTIIQDDSVDKLTDEDLDALLSGAS